MKSHVTNLRLDCFRPKNRWKKGDTMFVASIYNLPDAITKVLIKRVLVNENNSGYEYDCEMRRNEDKNKNTYWTFEENELFETVEDIKHEWHKMVEAK